MAGTWVNDDGLVVRFGSEQGKRGSRVSSTQSNSKEQELILTVDLEGAARTIFPTDNNNDGTLDGFSGLDGYIPAGSYIKGSEIITLEAPAGGTSYSVGTWQEDGSVIDADGIWTDAGADGALVATTLAANSYVSVKTIGTYTAGILKIVVRYVTV